MASHIDLSGIWRFAVDPAGDGEDREFHLPGHDDRGWREAAVPGCFDDYADELAFYQGRGWHRTTFTVPPEWRGRCIVLGFLGANYRTRAWLNGELLGENRDPFLPFEFRVEGVVDLEGTNHLAICVDNTCHPEDLPGQHIGWRNFGGILREVTLSQHHPVHVHGLVVNADATGRITVAASVTNNSPDEVELEGRVSIAEAHGEQVHCDHLLADISCAAGETTSLRVADHVKGIAPWSPDAPALYTAKVELLVGGEAVDSGEATFGFRTIEAQENTLLLNGEPIFLTGFNRHEDSPRTNMATDLDLVRSDLAAMKEAGSNFVRLCHYPHHPAELDLCDELGLLAMCEIPLYFWHDREEGRRHQPQRADAAERQLRTLIARDRNHPSVIFWSVSNETHEEDPNVSADNRRLIDTTRALDSSRLCVHVSNRWDSAEFDLDDVICVNGYPSMGPDDDLAKAAEYWTGQLADMRRRWPGKPVLVTEFGSTSLRAEREGRLSETRHAEFLEAEFSALSRLGFVCGTVIWCWADHAWPTRTVPFSNWLMTSPYGVLTRDRYRLRPFWTARRLFREKQGIADTPDPATERVASQGERVVMEREDLADIPDAPLPEGYRIRAMTRDDKGVWVDVYRDAEPYLPISPDTFVNEFGSALHTLPWRGFIAEDAKGVAVGTVVAWFRDLPETTEYGRIHWLAVRPTHQRKGIARALCCHALRAMAQWHTKAILGTSANRKGALALYESLGFREIAE